MHGAVKPKEANGLMRHAFQCWLATILVGCSVSTNPASEPAVTGTHAGEPSAATKDAGEKVSLVDARAHVSDADAEADAGRDVYLLPPKWSGGSPDVIESGNEAVSLAIDESHVFWQGTGGSLFACPLAGCGTAAPVLLSSLIGPSAGLQTLSASNGVAVFVSELGVDLTTLTYADPYASTALTVTGVGSSIGAVVTDATNLYVSSAVETDAGGYNLTIASCPLAGPCSTPVVLVSGSSFGAMFVADGELYFATYDEQPTLSAVSVHGGASRTVCSESPDGGYVLSDVVSLVVAGGYAYFTSEDDPSSIYQCPTSGMGSPSLYLHDYAPYALATDGQDLYWTNYVPGTGTVATCAVGPKCTSPFTVADNQDSPYAIAASPSSVFWTTPGAIYRADR